MGKNARSFIVLIMLIGILVGTFASAQASGIAEDYVTVYTCNVRSGPSVSNSIVDTVSDGTLLSSWTSHNDYTYSTAKWSYVFGSISGGYVRNDLICPANPGCLKVTTQSGLNVRTGGGTNYSIKFVVPYGTYLHWLSSTTDSSGNTWYYVMVRSGAYEGTYGWIIANYVKYI